MGRIQVLNQHGDQVIDWDPSDAQSISKAQGAFESLKKEGYEFFEAETKTQLVKGKKINSFKKDLGALIAVPGTGKGAKAMSGGPVRESSITV